MYSKYSKCPKKEQCEIKKKVFLIKFTTFICVLRTFSILVFAYVMRFTQLICRHNDFRMCYTQTQDPRLDVKESRTLFSATCLQQNNDFGQYLVIYLTSKTNRNTVFESSVIENPTKLQEDIL